MSDTLLGIVLVLSGLLAIISAALNWRIVTHSRKLLNILLGDMIARAIYMAAGFLLMVLGIDRFFGFSWFIK